jgi:alkylation response protein AidB-like acyl-CoA dehydrogenase
MEAHISLGCAPLAAYGTPAQKDAYLAKCATGEHLWAFGLTEENAGTDAGGTETTAELDGGHWVINGSKKWITNGGTDITAGVTAIARTGMRENGKPELTAIIVPQETPGFTRGPGYEKLGWRASDQRQLHFEDCRVPEENTLGRARARLRPVPPDPRRREGRGRRPLRGAGPGVPGRRALAGEGAEAVRAVHLRVQAIQFKLADMAMEVRSRGTWSSRRRG